MTSITAQELVGDSVNPLDSIKATLNTENEAESPFQDYTSMIGFNAQAWVESVRPHDALAEPIKHVGNAPTKTIYELITTSTTTSELANLLAEYPDIASILKDTDARCVGWKFNSKC